MAHLLPLDDDAELLPGKLRQLFPASEHFVEAANTGTECLKRPPAFPPDVILLDPRLPEQSGLEVFKHIRAIDAHIPVVFIIVAPVGRFGHQGDGARAIRVLARAS